MTSRQRVLAAIAHQPPDRTPIDLNICLATYQALKTHLNLDLGDDPAPNTAMEVIPDPELLTQLGVDLISVKLGHPARLTRLADDFTDAWSVRRRLVPHAHGAYYEAVSHPLADATLDDLKDFPWPTAAPTQAADDLAQHARLLHDQTDLALVGRFGGPILEIAADLLGMEQWYLRTALDPPFVAALLDRISYICTAHDLIGLDAAGPCLQIMKVSGEDLGMQAGPLYSPDTFQNLLLPPLQRRWQAVRQKLRQLNPHARLMLHSCGAIRPFIPTLIAAGIDILDPVQPLAAGMDPAELKTAFGQTIVFHGGIDVQHLLPQGSPEEVATATGRCLNAFQAHQGGFIVAPSHTVQADVTPANLLAMIHAAQHWAPTSQPPLKETIT